MSSQSTTEEEDNTVSAKTTVLLDIPPRLQWDNDNGYCGETALQSIGLYYGAWISQKLVYDINKGEYLLQTLSSDDWRDPLRTLTLLHFTYHEWDWKNSSQPQFSNFCHWMKRSILRKQPVMFGIFLPDSDFEDYDHIVPAVGIRYMNENGLDPDDELIYCDMYQKKKIERPLNENDFGSTRDSIDTKEDVDDGCIPLNISYGIAITGIVDENQVTLPVRLAVSAWKEPNPAFHQKPKEMIGIVTVEKLVIGKEYVLLRYSSYKDVPTHGDVNTFLRSNCSSRHQFTATQSTYEYEDPQKIPSTGSVYYRCVPLLE